MYILVYTNIMYSTLYTVCYCTTLHGSALHSRIFTQAKAATILIPVNIIVILGLTLMGLFRNNIIFLDKFDKIDVIMSHIVFQTRANWESEKVYSWKIKI